MTDAAALAAVPPVEPAPHLAQDLVAGAVASALALAAGLHLAALPGHAGEGAPVAAFFGAVAVLQLLAAGLVTRGAGSRTGAVMIAGNLALVALWALSRTAGVPVGAHAGVAEPVSLLDGLSVLAEITAVAGLLLLGGHRRPHASPTSRLAVLALAALLVGGAGSALARSTHGHSHPNGSQLVTHGGARNPPSVTGSADHHSNP